MADAYHEPSVSFRIFVTMIVTGSSKAQCVVNEMKLPSMQQICFDVVHVHTITNIFMIRIIDKRLFWWKTSFYLVNKTRTKKTEI